MNIVYHHRTRLHGGEGTHIRGVVIALRQIHHKVTIVSPYGDTLEVPADKTTKRSKMSFIYDFISNHLPKICFEFLELLYNFFAFAKLRNVLENNPVDFIFERYALFCFVGVLLSKRRNIPIFVEVNMLANLDDIRPIKLKWLARSLERYVFNKADIIITVSSYFKSQIVSIGIDPEKILVMPNAVNPDDFIKKYALDVRERLNIKDRVVIGFVGNLDAWWYRFDVLINIVSEIIKSGKHNIHLLLVGKEPKQPQLANLIESIGLANNLTITGWVDHRDMPDYLDAIDIAIIPEFNPWASPIKLFEYMVMGKPVIAPAYEPIKSIICSGQNGLLFEPGNYAQLKEALITLCDDPELCKHLGSNAQDYVKSNHTWEVNVTAILDLFHRITSND